MYSREEGIADHYWPWAVFFSPPSMIPSAHRPLPSLALHSSFFSSSSFSFSSFCHSSHFSSSSSSLSFSFPSPRPSRPFQLPFPPLAPPPLPFHLLSFSSLFTSLSAFQPLSLGHGHENQINGALGTQVSPKSQSNSL